MITGWEGELPTPQTRDVEEVRQVLAVPECPCSGPLYFMYRDLARTVADRTWLQKQGVQYDITVIPPKTLCGEYIKTKGHYHPDTPSGVGYPELYEVLSGEAYYLLQNRPVDDVVIIRASEGQKVLVPPGYGHVTINASSRTLTMSNLVARGFTSQYESYEKRHGAAYYVMLGMEIVENTNYPRLPPLREGCPLNEFWSGPVDKDPLYTLVERRKDLAFLTRPEKYEHLFRGKTAD